MVRILLIVAAALVLAVAVALGAFSLAIKLVGWLVLAVVALVAVLVLSRGRGGAS